MCQVSSILCTFTNRIQTSTLSMLGKCSQIYIIFSLSLLLSVLLSSLLLSSLFSTFSFLLLFLLYLSSRSSRQTQWYGSEFQARVRGIAVVDAGRKKFVLCFFSPCHCHCHAGNFTLTFNMIVTVAAVVVVLLCFLSLPLSNACTYRSLSNLSCL